MGQEMITFSAPQGVSVGQEMITFSAPQGAPVGQEMLTFSAPQGPAPKISQRAQNIVIYSVFCSDQEQNSAICDVFATTKNASVAKTPLCATLSQHNMSEMLYFTVFLERLLQNTGIYTKHRKYQRIQRLHFPWQQGANSKNTAIYSVSPQ